MKIILIAFFFFIVLTIIGMRIFVYFIIKVTNDMSVPSNKTLAEGSRKALEEFHKLPKEEQWKRMIDAGTINEKGEVLMGGDK